jgi:hypothetical protein
VYSWSLGYPLSNNIKNKMNQDVEKGRGHKAVGKRERSIDYLDKRAVPTKNIGQFILGEKLGEGTFGKVVLGTHILTGEKVKFYNPSGCC